MCFSIDGVGKVNDYIRWGSDWDTIERNIRTFNELPNLNVSIGPTVQLLNAYYYDELVDWAKTNNYPIYNNLLLFPKYYHLANSDDRIKMKVPEFTEWHNIPIDLNERELFIKYTKILDSSRGCNIRDYLPEIADIYGFD
jgi:sulfatase maturation enzyme AslB (radical SAM superfamily)